MQSIPEAAHALPAATVHTDTNEYAPDPATCEVVVTLDVRPLRSEPIAWWLWWNVLSLDAPAVALVWSVLLVRSSGLGPRVPEVAALVLAVWIIYIADRLLDGLGSSAGSFLQRRHTYCADHRLLFSALVLLSAGALSWIITERLEVRTVRAGLILGVIVVLYLGSIHANSWRFSRRVPKEIAVGMIFAAGTSLPLWSRAGRFERHDIFLGLLFGLLCSINCLSIECWERPRRDRERRDPPPWIRWADSHLSAIALGLTILAFFASCLPAWRGSLVLPVVAISLAASLTMLLNSQRKRLSPEALRVLADAALALPGLLALVLLYRP
jgi:hypothetical protein